ncbi:MAG: GTP pyrophosphokinase [Clostridia bacterium]|nr:GTP pyrophosphokinase [Clostridia bacterium]
MIYTPLTKLALRLAFDGHRDQVDKTGLPYVFHPFHLAEGMTDEATTCVALLHDIVEDTDMTIERLSELGFPDEYVEAIALMTHAPEVPYMDYVKEIKKNPIARAVKIADLTHNSDMTRLDTVDDYAIARAEKYRAALEILRSED